MNFQDKQPLDAIEEERTSSKTVAGLFFGAYFSPVIFSMILGLFLGNPGIGFFAAYVFVYFPSGLFGLVSESKDIAVLTVLGYVVYGILFLLAFSLRKYWQTLLLWAVMVSLLVLNVVGCRPVFDRVTAGMTLP